MVRLTRAGDMRAYAAMINTSKLEPLLVGDYYFYTQFGFDDSSSKSVFLEQESRE
jgi:hypothetical protein